MTSGSVISNPDHDRRFRGKLERRMPISDRWLRHLAGSRLLPLRITCESNCSIWGNSRSFSLTLTFTVGSNCQGHGENRFCCELLGSLARPVSLQDSCGAAEKLWTLPGITSCLPVIRPERGVRSAARPRRAPPAPIIKKVFIFLNDRVG